MTLRLIPADFLHLYNFYIFYALINFSDAHVHENIYYLARLYNSRAARLKSMAFEKAYVGISFVHFIAWDFDRTILMNLRNVRGL